MTLVIYWKIRHLTHRSEKIHTSTEICVLDGSRRNHQANGKSQPLCRRCTSSGLWPPHHRCPRPRPETCTPQASIPIFRKSATDLHANYTHGAGDVHSAHPCPHHLSALTVKGEGHRAGSLAVALPVRAPQRPAIGSMCWERLIRQYPCASFNSVTTGKYHTVVTTGQLEHCQTGRVWPSRRCGQ